jgi:hypothetical protein
MRNHFLSCKQVLIFTLILLLGATAAYADVTGSILGTVTDRSQGVVAGAKIVVSNAETNFSQETKTASDGTFRFLVLPVGTYKLSVSAGGFRPFEESGIVIKVNDQLRFDVVLDVGNLNEKVEISANAVQVQTENTQLGDVIDSKKMLALPLNGRSYIDLLGLQAGVAPASAETIQQDRPVSGGLNPGNISVNGQRETANAFLVNGGDVSEGRNLGAGLVPNLDSIEEFRLITNSFDAEYGKFSGAIMNAITKSGTNSFHGDVFEFLRNDKFDAKNYFFGGKSELRRNQFGYAAGGPAWKNRIFWFSDYQGTREVSGAEASANVLSDDQRQGIFDPASLAPNGTGTGTCQDPTTTNCVPAGTYWAQLLGQRLGYSVAPQGGPDEPYSFPGCASTNPVTGCVFPGGVIPQSAWDAPAKNILPYIPVATPGGCSGSVNYCNNSEKNSIDDDKFGERVDFNNQKTGNWSWYYHFDKSNVAKAIPGGNPGPSVPGFATVTPSRAQQFVMSNAKNFGSTAVNEARFSFFRTVLHLDNPAQSLVSLSSLGFITGAGTLGIIPSTTSPEYVPQVSFVGNSGLNIGVPNLNTYQPNTTYMVGDVFSKSLSRHTLKFGGEFRYLQVNERNFANPNGGFNFDGNVTGVDFADFLLGATCSQCSAPYTQAALQLLDSRTRYGGAFIQDTWKVKPNFTLNLGLRWEVSMPWYDTQGKLQALVPGQTSTVFPLSPTGLVFPGDKGVPQTLAPTKYDNFGPRIGLAYSPGFSDGALGKLFGGPGKTSIRAAFGLYYTSIEDLNLFYEVADAPFGLYWTSPVSVLMDEPFRIRASGASIGQRFPFTAPIPGDPKNATLDFSVYEPMNFFPGYNTHNKLSYAEHFNFSIQRELTKSTVLTLAYVGTGGHHLITQQEANPGSASLCMQLSAENAWDTTAQKFGCGPGRENDVYNTVSATDCGVTYNPGCVYSTKQSFNSPNFCQGATPQTCFATGNTYTNLTANSIYNAGQITVERRANDFTFLAAYTFAKGLDDSSAFGDMINFLNPKLSRGLSSSDITHNFVASYIWAIPFDRAFANAPKRLTQGWQVQGITRFASGFPIQMNEGNDDASLADSSSTDMPDRIGNVHTLNPRKVNPDCPTSDGTGCYFIPPSDPTSCTPSGGAFVINCALGTFGTSNRRFFHGPGFNNTDFGISKRTMIHENFAFDIRVEFFNIFNHAQFRNPTGNINDQNFGLVTGARDPRIGQISAKFYW